MIITNLFDGLDYETEKLARIFLPFEKILTSPVCNEENFAVTGIEDGNAFAKLQLSGKTVRFSERVSDGMPKSETELLICAQLFKCFREITGYSPEWGMLTGIRPAKLFLRYASKYGEDKAEEIFREKYFVSKNKARICRITSKAEENIISLSDEKSFSLYISVPFCPSRCNYCSFVSHSVEKAAALIPEYTNLLIEEIKSVADTVKEIGLRLETVYMGGGTPTTLSAEQTARVMNAVNTSFDVSGLREFTVEAGRPDTVTEDKLRAVKNGGATRISINPQTLNDEVLLNIGRKHTVNQFYSAFDTARKIGFDNINTDLIAGLTGDTYESFRNTVDGIASLSPESVTVHSLSVKHASSLGTGEKSTVFGENGAASAMVNYSYEKLCECGYFPYYMYRQSKTVENLENVGYSKQGKEGLYNVYIMDETHSIIACGASAVTKLRQYGTENIERIYNYKYPYEYVGRFDEMLKRKEKIREFYSDNGLLEKNHGI